MYFLSGSSIQICFTIFKNIFPEESQNNNNKCFSIKGGQNFESIKRSGYFQMSMGENTEYTF